MDIPQLGAGPIDAAQLEALTRMRDQGRSDSETAAVSKSIQAHESTATAFESMFVSLLLKEMRSTLPNGLFGEESSDVLGGMFDQYMGQHLAQSGSLGIREMILAEALPSAHPTSTANQGAPDSASQTAKE